MRSKDNIILKKVNNYINELKDFTNGYDYDKFCKDRKTINACVFDLSQIGELVSKFSQEFLDEYKNVDWRGLKALRNRIVHDYDGINLTMVWEVIDNEIAILQYDIQNILHKEN